MHASRDPISWHNPLRNTRCGARPPRTPSARVRIALERRPRVESRQPSSKLEHSSAPLQAVFELARSLLNVKIIPADCTALSSICLPPAISCTYDVDTGIQVLRVCRRTKTRLQAPADRTVLQCTIALWAAITRSGYNLSDQAAGPHPGRWRIALCSRAASR